MKSVHLYLVFVFTLLTGYGLTAIAQTTLPLSQTNTVAVVAKAQSGRILLRWTPASEQVWKQASQYWQNPGPYGYFVERRVVSRNNQAITGTVFGRLNTNPLLPATPAQWQTAWQNTPADSANLKVLKAAIYDDKTASAPSDTALHVVDKQTDDFDRYIAAMLVADQSYAGATLAGLAYVDETVLSNEQYEYRVVVSVPNGVPAIGSASFIIGLSDYRPLAAPAKPRVQFAQRNAMLNWVADTTVQGYHTYWIERSTDGISFNTRNRTPLLQTSEVKALISYQDTFPLGRRTYYYRLKGQTIFGETGTSAVVVGQSKDTVINVPRIKDARLLPNGSVQVSWQFPGDTLMPRADTLLKGFFVGVASKATDRIVPAKINIAPTDTISTISNYSGKVNSTATLYFTVGAIKKDGDTLLSSPVFVEPLDTIPPTAPRGLQGLITTTGMAQFSWQPNPEPDLLGYKVFRYGRKGEESVNITRDSIIVASAWRDSVNLGMLNSGVYYQVKALDRRYNESPLSAPLYLLKPDTIRPAAPLFQQFSVTTNGVRLRWANSFSRDVVRHTLYRRDATGSTWQTLSVFARRDTTVGSQTVAISDTAFTDAGAQASRSYTYLLLAEDAGGLQSDSTALLQVDVPASRGVQQTYLSVLNAQSNPDRSAVTLTWSYDAPGVAEYQLYRAIGRRPLGLWRMVSGLETTTDDNEVKSDTTYRYQLRASFRDGTLSNWQSVTITYRDTTSGNQLPYVVLPIPAQQATVGTSFSYTVPAATFADADNGIQSLRVLSNGLPPGLAASGATLSGVPLRAGDYTVTVQATDKKGLTVSTSFTITVNGLPVLLTSLPAQTVTVGQSFSYTVSTSSFFDGQSSTVQLTIISTGLPSGLVSSGATLSGTLSAPGPFTITVRATDGAGASSNAFFRLTGNRPPQLTTAIASQTATVGRLSSWTVSAGAFVDPEGQPLTVALLANGLPTGIAARNGGYIGTPTSPGTYSLTIRATDAFGATTDAPFTLLVNRPANIAPTVAATLATLTLTMGQSADYTLPANTFFDEDGQIVRVAISGTPPGLTAQSVRLSGTPTTAGTFTLTVTGTDDLSATVSTNLVIFIPTGPTPPVIAGSTSICPGQSAVLTASGCSAGAIQWSNGGTGSTQTVSPAQTTTYTATCQLDGLTSAASNALTVTAGGNVTASITGNLTICSGQSTTLTASGGSTYRWNTGATTAAVSVSTAGPYSVIVTTGSGCSATASTSLVVGSFCGIYVNCGGPRIMDNTGRVWQQDDGGTPSPYLKSSTGISSGFIVENTTDAPDVLFTDVRYAQNQQDQLWEFPVPNGTYKVSLYFAEFWDGCQSAGCRQNKIYLEGVYQETADANALAGHRRCSKRTYTVTVTDGVLNLRLDAVGYSAILNALSILADGNTAPTLTASISASPNLTICAGQTITLTASSNDPAATFRWNTGATTAAIQVSAAGPYSVTASNSSGTTAVSSVTVTTNNTPVASIAGTLTICSGQSTLLTASGGSTYRWSTGVTTAAISVSTAGSYSVTVSSGSSCSATAVANVVAGNAPVAGLTGNLTLCAGQSTTLTASGGGTYQWSTGATTPAISASATGTYSVTVSTGTGCLAVASANVVTSSGITAGITGNLSICAGQSTTLTASGGSTYRWNTGATTAAISVSVAGNYSVTVSSGSTCSAIANATVGIGSQSVSASIAASPSLTLCTGQSTLLTASGSNSYTWSTGATTAAISVTAAGIYSVSVAGGTSCPARASATVVSADRVADVLTYGVTGLNYSYYQQGFANNDVDGMTGLTPTAQGTTTFFDMNAKADHPSDYYGYEFTGYVQVTTAGQYTFYTDSDDGSKLWIGNQLVVDNNGGHATQTRSGQLCLGVGYHAIRLRYIQGDGNYNLSVSWQGPGISQQVIPANRLFRSDCPSSSIVGSMTICGNQATTLTASGGTNYRWNTGATTASISTSAAGPYSVTAVGSSGCSVTASTTVTSADRTADVMTYPVTGLNYSYYQQAFPNNDVDGLTGQIPIAQGTTSQFDLNAQAGHPNDNYGYEFTGYVQVTTAGQYTFYTDSDDGSKLWIGNQLIVDNNGTHGGQIRSGQLCLGIGYHAIRVRYTQGTSGYGLSVSWQGPGVSQQIIPANRLFRNDCPSTSIVGSLTLCGGQTTTLTASGGSTYRWNTGATTASLSVSTAGVYSVTAVGSSGCVVVASASVVSADRVAETLTAPTAGLTYSYYQQGFANNDVDNITGQTPTAQGTTPFFDMNAKADHPGENYGYEFTGYVQVTTAGQYTFYTDSDDGSKLWIGNQLIVDNNGSHAPQTRSGQICLGVGYHAIRLRYVQGGGGSSLSVSWQGPGVSQQVIPASRLYHN